MKKNNVGKVIAISAGVAALAAAGYFFLGPNGKKNRNKARGWMIKMKGEVVEKLESMQNVTKETYEAMVDTVSSLYVAVGGKIEVEKLAKELKGYWKIISNKATAKTKKVDSKKLAKSIKK